MPSRPPSLSLDTARALTSAWPLETWVLPFQHLCYMEAELFKTQDDGKMCRLERLLRSPQARGRLPRSMARCVPPFFMHLLNCSVPQALADKTRLCEQDVMVVNHKGNIYALSPKCPHLGLPMKTVLSNLHPLNSMPCPSMNLASQRQVEYNVAKTMPRQAVCQGTKCCP